MPRSRNVSKAVYEFRNASAPKGVRRLRGAEALAAVAHPLRSKLLTHLGEARSVKELAELVGAPPSRLYHHVQRLVAAGIVVVAAGRQVGSNTENLYQVVARRIEIVGPDLPGQAVDGTVNAFDEAASVSDELAWAAANDELAVVARWVSTLSEEQALSLARKLVSVADDADAAPPAAGGASYRVQVVVTRTDRRSGSRLVASTVSGFEREPPPATTGTAKAVTVKRTRSTTKGRGATR